MPHLPWGMSKETLQPNSVKVSSKRQQERTILRIICLYYYFDVQTISQSKIKAFNVGRMNPLKKPSPFLKKKEEREEKKLVCETISCYGCMYVVSVTYIAAVWCRACSLLEVAYNIYHHCLGNLKVLELFMGWISWSQIFVVWTGHEQLSHLKWLLFVAFSMCWSRRMEDFERI